MSSHKDVLSCPKVSAECTHILSHTVWRYKLNYQMFADTQNSKMYFILKKQKLLSCQTNTTSLCIYVNVKHVFLRWLFILVIYGTGERGCDLFCLLPELFLRLQLPDVSRVGASKEFCPSGEFQSVTSVSSCCSFSSLLFFHEGQETLQREGGFVVWKYTGWYSN